MNAATITRNGTTDNVSNEKESQAVVKVLDPSVTPVKHPLNHRWCLWYYINDKNVKWEDSQVKVATYDTVEDFWALINHIEQASRLKVGCDYSLFKDGIKPMWEDDANINGGRWSVSLAKQQRASDLDNMWMEMIMMMVGENEEECVNNEVCGAVVSVRPRGDRLALWTATSKNQELALKVGRSLKRALNLGHNQVVEFNLHSDTSNKRSSSVRALYTV